MCQGQEQGEGVGGQGGGVCEFVGCWHAGEYRVDQQKGIR